MLYEIQPTGPAHRLATQKVGYDQQSKSTAAAKIAETLGIISQMAPREFDVILRKTADKFNVFPRTYDEMDLYVGLGSSVGWAPAGLYLCVRKRSVRPSSRPADSKKFPSVRN